MIACAGVTPQQTLPRRSLAVLLACAAAAWLLLVAAPTAGAAPVRSPTVLTLADTLGAAGTSGRLAQPALDGYALAFDQSVGPLFEVTRPTVVTEVGGYVQDPFQFPAAGGVLVEIHPARPNGVPNRDVVVASSPVSIPDEPGLIGYGRAPFASLLRPGTYYALFAVPDQTPPASSDALLAGAGRLRTASGAFVPYSAPPGLGGVTHPDNYEPGLRELRLTLQAAARVLGVGLPFTSDDCRAAQWKTLADEQGRPLHDAAQCKRVVASVGDGL